LGLLYIALMIMKAFTETLEYRFIKVVSGFCQNHIPDFAQPFFLIPGSSAYSQNTRAYRQSIGHIKVIQGGH
jgi:hypothetical protein